MNSDGANTNNRNDDSPPRQRARPGDQADPAVERAFDYLLHTLFHARTEPSAMAPNQHEREEIDISDMPPLEPLSAPATTAPTTYDSYSQPSGASLTLPSSSMDIDSSSHPHIQGSLGMQFIQQSPATDSTAPGPSSGRNRRYISGQATGRTRNRANNDTDNDMPDLLDVSDSDEDADADDVEMLIRDSNTSGSRFSVNMEEQIVQDLADMPALEQANRPRRTTVEDDPEGTLTSSLGRVPPTSANPDAVRTGSRRTRAEVDDADNDEAGPDTSPSTSVYVTPASTPTQTPSRAATPAGGPAPANHPDRLLRPLPRNGPPPLRTTATPVNMNALFGAPGFATAGLGQAFDANTLLRQFFHGITGLQNVAQAATQTNGNANANANANQGQAPPPLPPPPSPQSQPATRDAATPNTEAQTHANADRVNAGREASPWEDVRMGVHFIDDGEDFPMADGFPFGGVFDFGALHEHRQNPTGPPRAPEQDGAPRANPNAGATGAGAGTEGTEMNMFFEMMRALMGGDAAGNFGDFSALFGDYNREDPERARRLVAGMEAVPEGLIKRMECVGGAPGAHEDTSGGAGGEEAQCAVCWDSLLNAEGDSFESVSQPKKEETAAEGSQEAPAPASDAAMNQIPSRADGATAPTPEVVDAAGVSSGVPPIAEPPALASEPGIAVEEARETKKEQEVKEEKEKEKDLPPLPKVVSLPCAHVFHASCLLPWFSRPGQTTCPVCRFNIDPENLTYQPPQRARPPQQQQQSTHRMPGMHTPTGMDTGAHWTIHAGEGILPPWAIMHGANRADVTPAAANANMRPGIARVARPAGAAPLRAQPRETGPTQAGAANNATRTPRVQGPTQPVFPFPPFQHGPHVHPNIHPHLLHQRFQADQRHHGPRSQTQAPFQPGPHFHPNIHRRGTQVGQQQQTSAPQPQAQPQTQPGPHFHPNIHPDFFHQRVHGRQQPQQQQQPPPPPPPQQQQQQRHRTTIVAHGVFNPDEPGDMLTMNFDLFFAPPFPDPNDPLGHQQHDHVHAQGHDHSMPNAGEAGGGGRPANPANASGAASSGTADGAQQDARAGGQQANEERTFVEIFTRTIPFATEFGGVRPAGGVGMAGPGATPRSRSAPARPRERKEWTVPPPPGLTLRQRVEKREREADLRCDDVSCGLGPTDEDPLPRRSSDTLKTIAIRRDGAVGESAEPVCIHHLHAACLVDAGRVAGWGAHDEGDAVEVSCPVCRAVGHVEHEEWEAGVTASEAVLA